MGNCPKCDAAVKPDHKFCTRCGTDLQVTSRYTGDTTPASVSPKPSPEASSSRTGGEMDETSLHQTGQEAREAPVPDVAQREVEVLVIDRSGSTSNPGLHGTKLQDIMAASRKHILQKRHVDREDYIALVSFSKQAKTECGWSQLEAPQPLLTAVKGLSAGGNTCFRAGLEEAETLLGRLPVESGDAVTKKILFLTDGHNNQGEPDEAAERLRSAGVIIQAIGFEARKKDVGLDTLERMVSVIDGQKQYWFCSNLRELTQTITSLTEKTQARF